MGVEADACAWHRRAFRVAHTSFAMLFVPQQRAEQELCNPDL